MIKDVEKTDGGDYVCVAENMAGVKQSDVATLSVHGTHVLHIIHPFPQIILVQFILCHTWYNSSYT